MLKILLTAAVLGLFVLAGAQSALADDDRGRSGRGDDGGRDADGDDATGSSSTSGAGRPEGKGPKDDREGRDGKGQGRGDDRKGPKVREEHGPKHFGKAEVSLQLNGTAQFRNETYTFELAAEGQASQRVKAHDADFVRYNARLQANVVLLDANGTAVHEGDMQVRLFARSDGNETKWVLGSVAKPGGVRFVLKGTVEDAGDGAFNLTGRGHAVLKLDGERARPMRLEAEGTFTRTGIEMPPADESESGTGSGTTSAPSGSATTSTSAPSGTTTASETSSAPSETTSTPSETTSSQTSSAPTSDSTSSDDGE